MDFGILIIPLIALAIWVLQYIFRGPEDNKQQAKPRGGPRTAVNKPRRQVSDLDRFLEETRKKKQQDESKPVVIAEVVPEKPPADRGESVERERRAASRPKPQPAQRPSRQERKQRAQQPAPEPRRPLVGAPLRPTAVPVLAEVVPITVAPIADPPRVHVAPTTTRNPSPPVLVELVKMLHNPRGAAMAMILREIFDTPVSRRRGAI